VDFPAYYVATGLDVFAPTAATTSPWDESAQHGGPPTALLATAMEQAIGDPQMRTARITAEFLGVIPRREAHVVTRVVRPGRRIALTEADLVVDGRTVVTARAWHLRVGRPPPEGTNRPEAPSRPHADPQPQVFFPGLDSWGYGESIEWRYTFGGLHRPGPGAVWTRLRVPLIEGQPLTGLQRALVVADAANGISTELPLESWYFIPTGLNVNLLRYTGAEWVHLAAETDVGTDGIGLTVGTLADDDGTLGQLSQPLVIAPR
jgi:hypothetical protein